MSITTPTAGPDPTIDFVGLYADQTEEVILGRMVDWANEGKDPVANADQWVDTREGGHWFTAVMPGVREIARVYDLMGTEVPMSAFVLWAWGTYLDDLAAAYNVDRKPAVQATGVETFSGPAGTDITVGTTIGTVPLTADDPTPTFHVTEEGTIPDAGGGVGTIDLPIQADDGGAVGDVAAGAVIAVVTPLPAGVSFTNAAPTQGGEDPETDDALRTRVLEAMVGQGGANVAAYLRWAAAWPGVGAVKVIPAASGPNTVLVVVTDPTGAPLAADIVTGLQADLDPVPGKGSGTAPVGAEVTVETSVDLLLTVVVGAVVYAPGYSADGAGNTIAVRGNLEQAIIDYLLTVLPGDYAYYAHIAGLVATQEGIEDATGITVNGGTADIPVGTSPPESPQLQTLTLP